VTVSGKEIFNRARNLDSPGAFLPAWENHRAARPGNEVTRARKSDGRQKAFGVAEGASEETRATSRPQVPEPCRQHARRGQS
jgi:hypothetical protein